jgi:hypothetical protein
VASLSGAHLQEQLSVSHLKFTFPEFAAQVASLTGVH